MTAPRPDSPPHRPPSRRPRAWAGRLGAAIASVLLLLVLAAAGPATLPSTTGPTSLPAMLVEASDHDYWVLQRHDDFFLEAPSTSVRRMSLDAEGDGKLHELGWVSGEVASVAHLGSRLVIVFDDGSWGLFSEGGLLAGPALPGDLVPLLAAGDDARLWFLAVPDSDPASPATRPTTGRAAASPATAPAAPAPASSPAVRPLSHRFVAIERRSDGVFGAPIPIDALDRSSPGTKLSLALLQGGDLLLTATPPAGGAVRTVRIRDGHAESLATIPAGDSSSPAHPLPGLADPTACVVRPDGTVSLFTWRDGNWSARSVKVDPQIAGARPVPVVIGREVRLTALVDDQVRYQIFDPASLSVREAKAAKQTPSMRLSVPMQVAQVVFLMAIMLTVLFVSTRPAPARPERGVGATEPPVPAPLHRRLAAGLVDAFPLVAFLTWLTWDKLDSSDGTQELLLWAAVGGYLVYTAVAELLSGRTIGKALFGLRVVTVTGGRPQAWQLVVRNALRLVDFTGFLLSTVVFSPLRQRVGDYLAGTTVVADDAAEGDVLKVEPAAEVPGVGGGTGGGSGQGGENAENPAPPADNSRRDAGDR